MPSKRFKLEDNGSSDLVVSWKRSYKDTKVFYKGEIVCSFSDQQELEDGGLVELPDGSDLDISLMDGDLVILRDGMPVPGSSTSAHLVLKRAVYSFYAMAFFNILLGAYVVFALEETERANQLTFFGLTSVAFVICGCLTGHRKRMAVYLGLLLTALYIWFWVVLIANAFNNIAALVFLIVHIFLVMKIISAFSAIKRISAYLREV